MGLSPARSPEGAAYLYNPPTTKLPLALSEIPKGVVVSDLVVGWILTRLNYEGRHFRKGELQAHLGREQFTVRNEIRKISSRYGRPYVDAHGEAIVLNGVALTGAAIHQMIGGSLSAKLLGYGGENDTEERGASVLGLPDNQPAGSNASCSKRRRLTPPASSSRAHEVDPNNGRNEEEALEHPQHHAIASGSSRGPRAPKLSNLYSERTAGDDSVIRALKEETLELRQQILEAETRTVQERKRQLEQERQHLQQTQATISEVMRDQLARSARFITRGAEGQVQTTLRIFREMGKESAAKDLAEIMLETYQRQADAIHVFLDKCPERAPE